MADKKPQMFEPGRNFRPAVNVVISKRTGRQEAGDAQSRHEPTVSPARNHEDEIRGGAHIHGDRHDQ